MHNLWLKSSPLLVAPSGEGTTVGATLFANRRRRKIAVAIVGLDEAIAEKTRSALYNYNWSFGDLTVVDAGNLRKTTPEFLTPLLRELHGSGITPILIGSDRGLFRAQYEAFAEINRQVSLLNVDQRLRLGTSLAPASAPKTRYHLGHIGAQEHLVADSDLRLLRDRNFEYMRLGSARKQLEELEPMIRDADLAGFDISAVQYAEAPARSGFDPSGFLLQEACQMAFYAGNSDKLASFGLYGIERDGKTESETNVTTTAYAQLIWYFLKGFASRKGDFPATTEGMLEYIVDNRDFDRITFWRSPRSNRWWMQLPAGRQQGEERHRLIPCSYADYTLASKGENLPERLFAALRRYG